MNKSREHRMLPRPGEGKRGESGYLGYLLRQAANAYRNRAERALVKTGVTQPQFAILTMLAAYPSCSNADLARMALLTPQTVNAIVAKLQKAGAITRRPHAVHGRIQQLEITEEGRRRLNLARTQIHALERELMADVDPDALQHVRNWLVKVAADAPETAAKP